MSEGPPPPPGSERRKSARVELLAQVELRRGEGDILILPIVNISAGGAFLRLEGSIKGMRVGDVLSLFLDLGDDESLVSDAEVVRVDLLGGGNRPPGVAVRWASSDPEFPAKLTRALERVTAR